MGQYLIDNNVISNYFSGLIPEKNLKLISSIIDQTPNLSVITEIEALSWVNPDKGKEVIVKTFVQESNILGISPPVVARCVAIRRSKKIKTPDAIIAATAIANNLILLSSDSVFDGIAGLQLLDPMK